MTTAQKRISNETDTARARMRDVKEDVSQLRHDVSDVAAGAAHAGVESIRSGASHVADTGRKAVDTVRDSHRKMCSYVESHPTASLLIAAGVGAILARVLLMRR